MRSTHLFLSEEEIRRISGFVPRALREIPHLIALRDEQKKLVGFMGIGQGKLEMLFLAPEQMGKGSGSRLVQYGIDGFGVREVCVNEQIPPRKSSMNSWDLPSIKEQNGMSREVPILCFI